MTDINEMVDLTQRNLKLRDTLLNLKDLAEIESANSRVWSLAYENICNTLKETQTWSAE